MGGIFGGGSTSQTHVAKYFISLHYGICTGPVDSINKMVIDDKIVDWGGFVVNANSSTVINQTELFGGEKKQGGLQGIFDFMLGGPTQQLTAGAAGKLGGTPDTLPGFRGIASIFARGNQGAFGTGTPGFYWTANNPYLSPPSVEVTRVPVGPNGKAALDGDQANFADIIWECLTDTDWGLGSPEGLLDRDSFKAAATTLGGENFWGSMMWTRQDVVEKFINEVIDHIQATLFAHPRTGLLTIRLLRDDYDRDALPVFTPDNCKITKFQRKVWGETANEVIVSWTNPESEESESVVVHNNANISIQGSVVSTSKNYYGVRNADLAARLALRDLTQVSEPFLALNIEANRTAWTLVPGDMCKIQYPEHGIGEAYMRVGTVDYGKPGASIVKAALVEDIFSFGTSIFVPVGESLPPTIPVPPTIPDPDPPLPPDVPWVDPATVPTALDHLLIRDVPFFVLARAIGDAAVQSIEYPSTGNMILAAEDSTNVSAIGYWTQIYGPTGEASLQHVGFLNNRKRALLTAPLAAAGTSTLAFSSPYGSPIDVGSIMEFVSVSNPNVFEMAAVAVDNGDGTYQLTRGILDTTPLRWKIGDVVWNYPANSSPIDPTGRTDNVDAIYKFTPRTSKGMYSVSSAALITQTAHDRMHLPYRPANVKFNGDLYSQQIVGTSDIVVTWSRRNRLTESSQILAWTDADTTPETGQTTVIEILDGSGTVSATHSGLTGTTYTVLASEIATAAGTGGKAFIRVKSVRDGFESLNPVTRKVTTIGLGGYGLNYGKDYGAV
ncbi:phage tail protein [Bradyrhizobium sp. WSM3983]|uniref:phage tail protein n=1 Tax=Bradyrhizobium sp. WSM3983 TaxID=1038867 RepID=UPI00042232D6|nr:phage tail protein [Bradyrhizobium sp. WSM3983]